MGHTNDCFKVSGEDSENAAAQREIDDQIKEDRDNWERSQEDGWFYAD